MFAEVEEHIDESSTSLARRGERAGVVALGPHWTSSANGAIYGARRADGEALDAADESEPFVGLDDQMDVIGLDREVNDAEGVAARGGEGLLKNGVSAVGAERRDVVPRSQSDVDRVPAIVRGPSCV
jgi:hypothetical protein